MQYSKKIANQKDFSYEINKERHFEDILNNRFRTLEYDKNISKKEIEEAICFDHYICKLVDESKHRILNTNEINYIKKYINYILKVFLKINDKQQLLVERLVSKNEFPILSSHFNELKVLFKNDSNMLSALNLLDDKYKKLIDKKIRPAWEKYRDGKIVSDDERELLARYFCANIPCEHDGMNNMGEFFFKNELKRLLSNEPMPNISLRMLEFISKYAAFDAIKQQLKNFPDFNINDYYFIYCYELDNAVAYAYQQENEIAFGYNGFINSKIKYKNDRYKLFSHIRAMAHETRHMLQFELRKSNNIYHQLSDLSVSYQLMNIFFKYLNYGNTSEYNKNYNQQEIEHDANRYSYFYIDNLLRSLKLPRVEEEIGSLINEYRNRKELETKISFRYDEQDRKLLAGTFKIGKLDEIVRKNPQCVTETPMLKYLYNIDGSYKDPIEVLEKFDFRELHYYPNGFNFMLQYFLYRYSRNQDLFNNVLFESNNKNKLENMFQLWRVARNELLSFNHEFDTYMDIPGYKKSDVLKIIEKKSTELIKLMDGIYHILIKGNYKEINPEFKMYYIDLNVMLKYKNTYKEILNKIANYESIQNNQRKPRH